MTAPICLVSMPFMPGTMPSLGLSLLKSALERSGIECDVLYGSTILIETMAQRSGMDVALFDYQLIGSTGHLGDLMFASAFWGYDWLDAEIRRGLETASAVLPAADRAAFARRHDPASGWIDEALARCLAVRDWRQFRIVGFSSTFAQSLGSLWLARHIRRIAPDTKILFGGANVDGTMGAALLDAFPFVDHVIQGEADRSLPLYAEAVLREDPLPPIPGLVRREAGRAVRTLAAVPVTDLDLLPIPDFSDFFSQLPPGWTRDRVMLPFETSRGCWWGEKSHCIFCGLNAEAMGYRAKSGRRALSEIETLAERWQVRRMCAVDNILPREYFTDLLPDLAHRGIELFYETKANLHQWQVAGLAAAGVTQIQPGVESLSTRLLTLMKKGVSRRRNIQLLRWCQAYSVDPLWFYLYGFPGDDKQDYLEDAALMRRLVHLPPPRSINPVTIDRFSPLYSQSQIGAGVALTQQPEHRAAFAGLSDAQSQALCYHFEARVGTADPADYVAALAGSVDYWKRRYAVGVQLSLLAGRNCSLIYDDRAAGEARLFLLSGLCHQAYRALDLGGTAPAVAERCARDRLQEPDSEDLPLIMAAIAHGAEFPPDLEEVEEVLGWLDRRALVVRDGQVWQALAVPGLPLMTAALLGLEKAALQGWPVLESAAPSAALAQC